MTCAPYMAPTFNTTDTAKINLVAAATLLDMCNKCHSETPVHYRHVYPNCLCLSATHTRQEQSETAVLHHTTKPVK